MHKTQVERTRRLRESKARTGQKQVTVWVPVDRVEELKALAYKWRKGFVKNLSSDSRDASK